MCANNEGSGETARMRRLAWAFTGRQCDKYQIVRPLNQISILIEFPSNIIKLFLNLFAFLPYLNKFHD